MNGRSRSTSRVRSFFSRLARTLTQSSVRFSSGISRRCRTRPRCEQQPGRRRAGGRAVVPSDRVGDEDLAPTEQRQPPRQVEVVAVAERAGAKRRIDDVTVDREPRGTPAVRNIGAAPSTPKICASVCCPWSRSPCPAIVTRRERSMLNPTVSMTVVRAPPLQLEQLSLHRADLAHRRTRPTARSRYSGASCTSVNARNRSPEQLAVSCLDRGPEPDVLLAADDAAPGGVTPAMIVDGAIGRRVVPDGEPEVRRVCAVSEASTSGSQPRRCAPPSGRRSRCRGQGS